MIQKNKHYKLHSQRLACYKVQQRKTYNSMEPHHLHVPQADMLVADSKPESVPYSSSEQPATVKTLQPKIGQNHWNGSGKWYLWTHKGKLLLAICIFGWWSSRLFCVKPTLSYLFKTFLQHLKMRQVWHENHCLFYSCSDFKFYLRNWNVEILRWHPCSAAQNCP